jgi:hypothetical protein
MFSKLHDKLGTAGFVVAIVPLVAIAGSGFAAKYGVGKEGSQVKPRVV